MAALGAAVVASMQMSGVTMPDVAHASLPDLFEYLAAPRGFAQLELAEQDRFVDGLIARFREDGAHRELRRGLDACSDAQIKAIQVGLEPLAFRRIIAQAREYTHQPREKRFEFLKAFDEKSSAETAWLKGFGDPAKDLTGRLGTGLPSNPEEFYKYIHAHTTPAERQVLEAFVNDLKSYHAVRRAGGGAAPAPASSSHP